MNKIQDLDNRLNILYSLKEELLRLCNGFHNDANIEQFKYEMFEDFVNKISVLEKKKRDIRFLEDLRNATFSIQVKNVFVTKFSVDNMELFYDAKELLYSYLGREGVVHNELKELNKVTPRHLWNCGLSIAVGVTIKDVPHFVEFTFTIN
jgi:hypothetical protein